jgi:hypothetical protein
MFKLIKQVEKREFRNFLKHLTEQMDFYEVELNISQYL